MAAVGWSAQSSVCTAGTDALDHREEEVLRPRTGTLSGGCKNGYQNQSCACGQQKSAVKTAGA